MVSIIGTSTSDVGANYGGNVSVTFASNGVALVGWNDGTNAVASYASSPYTSWTKLTAGSATNGADIGMRLDTGDAVNYIYSDTASLRYAPFTLSGTTYSRGSVVQISAVAAGAGNVGIQIVKDTQNRYWALQTNQAGNTITIYDTTTPGTASWPLNKSISQAVNTTNIWPCSDITGNYLIVFYATGSNAFFYTRLDVSQATLGAWSTATSFTPGGSSPTWSNFYSFRGNSTTGVLANDSGSGIWARVYNPSADTWASAVQLSSNGNDIRPSVVAGSDGNFYVFWSQFIATSNYAIVYKKYTTASSTWDSAATIIDSGGAENWPVSGGSNNGMLGIVYESGSSSPFNLKFAAISLASATTTNKDITVRGKISAQTRKDITVRAKIALLARKDITVRGKIVGSTSKDITARGKISAGVSKDITVRGNIVGPPLLSGGFALLGNSASGTASFDHFRVTQYPDPAILLTPATRAANSLVAWNTNTPTNTSVALSTSLDNGVTWSNVAASGDTIPGISLQPDPTVDTFGVDSSASYTSSNGTSGSLATWTWDTTNKRLIAVGGSRAVLLYNGLTVSDVDMFVDLKQAQNSGIVWRYSSASNYYELVVKDSTNGNTYTLNKMASGTLSQLASGSIAFAAGTHHYVRVTMLSGVITAYFDGTQVLTYTDGSPIASGQTGIRNDTGASYIYQLLIQPQGEDVTGLYLCEKWTLTSTDPTVTPQVLDTQAFVANSTFGTGVLIPSANNYADAYVSSNIDDLNKQSNYWWYISSILDANGKFPVTFQARDAIPAPFPMDSANSVYATTDGQQIGDMLIANLALSNAADLYRNRQKIKNAIATGSFTQIFTGDGQATTWNVANPIVSPPVNITLNGQSVTIGVQGVDTGKQFYYQLNSTAITQDSSGAKLQDTDTLVVPYVGSYYQDIVVNNAHSGDFPDTQCQDDIAALDGSTGIVTNVIDVKQQNMSVDAATTLANQLLTRYGNIGVTVTFTTLRYGLAPGQQLTMYCPQLNIDDVQLLITDVETTEVSSAVAVSGILYQFTVTATTTANLGSWVKLLTKGLGG